MFRDGVGRHMTEPCWVRGRSYREVGTTDRFVIVPAFNCLLRVPVNVIDGSSFPIINSGMTDLIRRRYLLDSIFLVAR